MPVTILCCLYFRHNTGSARQASTGTKTRALQLLIIWLWRLWQPTEAWWWWRCPAVGFSGPPLWRPEEVMGRAVTHLGPLLQWAMAIAILSLLRSASSTLTPSPGHLTFHGKKHYISMPNLVKVDCGFYCSHRVQGDD